ncbi:MAG: tetratricopeptide repeat protein [Elusimicrobiota bacterium]
MIRELSAEEKHKKNDYIIMLAIFALAFAVRFIYFFEMNRNPADINLIADFSFYHNSALRLLNGDYSFNNRVFSLSPVYSIFLAIVYSLFGINVNAVRIIQIIVSAFTCVFVYKIACGVESKRTGIIAGVLTAFYAPLIYFSHNILNETILIFSNVMMIYFLVNHDDKYNYLLSGIFMGFSMILRPNVGIFLLLAPIIIQIRNSQMMLVDKLSRMALFCLATIVFVIPFTVRNYIVGKDLVLLTDSAGLNFYIGNNGESKGLWVMPKIVEDRYIFGPDEHESVKMEANKRLGRMLKPSESSKYWFIEGIRYIANNKLHYLGLAVDKVKYLLNDYEAPDNTYYDFDKRFSYILRSDIFTFGLMLPIAIIGMAFSLREYKKYLAIYGIILGYAAFLVLFFVTSRYRIVMTPFLIIFAAVGINSIIVNIRNKKLIAVILAGFIGLWLICNQKVRELDVHHCYYYLAKSYANKGDYGNAIKEYENAIKVNPMFSGAYLALGNLYLQLGKYSEAEEMYLEAEKSNTDDMFFVEISKSELRLYFYNKKFNKGIDVYRKAIKVNPGNKILHINMGMIYCEQGMYKEAEKTLNIAKEIDKNDPLIRYYLGVVYMSMQEYGQAIKEFTIAKKLNPGLKNIDIMIKECQEVKQ